MIHADLHDIKPLNETFLDNLATSDALTAQQKLQHQMKEYNLSPARAASALAEAALAHAEETPQKATQWLELAQKLYLQDPQPAVKALVAYAEARISLQHGQLAVAQELLQQAQVIWQSTGDDVAAARTLLGLTQILTLQGEYGDAQHAIDKAITILHTAVASDLAVAPLLVNALRNQANLFGYLHNHQDALVSYERAQQILLAYRNRNNDGNQEFKLAYEEASIASNRAVDLMALARLDEAEDTLKKAIQHFATSGDQRHRSYAISNLASLYARTGQYQQALESYEHALELLWGPDAHPEMLSIEDLQASDVMLLDQALVFLALNLQSAAMHALSIAEKIFTEGKRPYELGQTLYAKGILHLQEKNWSSAATALTQAETIFDELNNRYWRNRATMARISLLQQQQDVSAAQTLINTLIDGDPLDFEKQWYGWDLGTATELYLQQLHLHLQTADVAHAHKASATIDLLFEAHFAGEQPSSDNSPSMNQENAERDLPSSDELRSYGMPHLRFVHLYASGRIARAEGNLHDAQRYFHHAASLLEAQRATLPFEEVRIAYLGDKATIYTDWVLTLIDQAVIDTADYYDAFAIVERARSRVLLERLLNALEDSPPAKTPNGRKISIALQETDVSNQTADVSFKKTNDENQQNAIEANSTTQREMIRRRLHWLYNELLSADANQRQAGDQLIQIRTLEHRLEQLEHKSTLPTSANPVRAEDLQGVLQPNEQTLAYYIAGEEILVFLVTKERLQLFRKICTVQALTKVHRDLLFQLRRVGTDALLLTDLDRRSQRLLLQALERMAELLIEPVLPFLTKKRLKIIPYGILHQLPFHAFRIEGQYLIERFDCHYIPSASIAVHQKVVQRAKSSSLVWSGLAVTDQEIAETENEVKMAATFFTQPKLYVGNEASRAGLHQAANEADILHISTHGLMRNDNPLFSSLKLADGWIDVREIYRLDLRAQVVVLSACRSGLSQITHGDEMLGLVRGFLGAGAQTLIVSQWDVYDRYAPDFMCNFYTHFVNAQQDPIAALRQAQCLAIAEGHHPFWWAPFFVIGQP